MKLSPIVDHGYLLGLGDDDHPQYLHLNKVAQTLQQNLAVTGGVTIDGVDISAHAGNVNAHIDNLTDIPTRNHNDLLNIGVSDHHARYTNAEAVAAVQANGLSLSGNLVLTTTNPYIRWYDTDGALNEKDARMYWYEGGLLFRSHNDNGSTKLNLLTIAHNGNIGVAAAATVDGVDISAHAANASAHHAQAHTLASHSTKAHSELTGVTAAQHHAKYLDTEAVAAVSAGNLTKLVVETDTLVADDAKVGIGIPSPTTIHADAPLFGGSSPKTEIVTGTAGNVDYQELVTLRHTGMDATARTRRLGLLLKLSSEGSVTETNKSGGMVVESPSGWANSPSLYLLTANAKRLGIDYNGDISVITGNVSLAADRTVDGVDISAHIPGISFNLGLATVGTILAQALLPGTYVVQKVRLYADTAPTGVDLIVDINKNGTTIFTTQANRPKIVAGQHSGVSGTPNITSFAEGDRLSIDIDQVGSTTPGGNDLLVTII